MEILPLLSEKYDKDHKCLTPDAMYSTEITPENVKVSVTLPFKLDLNKDETIDLEAKLHYAVEKVLASYFPKTD